MGPCCQGPGCFLTLSLQLWPGTKPTGWLSVSLARPPWQGPLSSWSTSPTLPSSLQRVRGLSHTGTERGLCGVRTRPWKGKGKLNGQPASHRPTPRVSLMPLDQEYKVHIRVETGFTPERDSSRGFLYRKNADFSVTYDPTGTHPGQLTCSFSWGKGSLDSCSLGDIQLKN